MDVRLAPPWRIPMERVLGHVIRGFVLVAGIGAAAGLVPACVHDNSTIFVSDVLAPPFVTGGMACTFTADPTQPVLGQGTLDVGLRTEYSAELLVGNQLVPQANPNGPSTETSFVTIEGAVVRIVDATGKQLNTYTKPVAATIPPSSGTTPGYASMNVTLIDSTTAGSLSPPSGGTIPLVSYVRMFGHTLGGESVESNDFGFPINVCRGCLIEASANACASMTGTTSSSVPCVVGQDLPVSVCSINPIVDAGGGG
jgi:hypothetical protein